MTAPAAAPASGPIAPPAPRASPEPPADRLAFAAVLDSLPGAAAKAGAATAEKQARASDGAPQDESQRGQPARHSALGDGALLASLPFALRAASLTDENREAANNTPSLPAAATKGPSPEPSGASIAASAKTAAVGRLIGERAFHFGASTITSRALAVDAPFAPAANLAPRADSSGESALAAGFPQAEAAVPSAGDAAATIGPRAGAAHTNRASATRPAAHEAARNGRKPEVSAPPPVTGAATSAAAHAPAESSGKALDGRQPDPAMFAAPSAGRTDPFGAFVPPSLGAGPSFDPNASTIGAAAADIASRASPLTSPAAAAPPVREIDVDLSPGGLEDVSMTMRLAGDKLSVVIRAASSHTLNSIEGARDAIADRMAAIGQTLDSLVVKQTGVNVDGNANGNASSADGGSAGGEQRSAQGARERGDSNNANLSRRGAGRDRSF